MKENRIEDARRLAEEKGGKCLSTECVGVHTHMEWACGEEHTWVTSYNNIRQGSWCPECFLENKRKTIEDAQRLAEEKGGKCLSKEFTTANTRMEWKCSQGHVWATAYANIQQGKWCSECHAEKQKHTIEDAQKLAQEKGGKCLSTEYVDSKTCMEWECHEEHTWVTSYNSIRQGSWCPECYREKQKHTIKDAHKLAEKKLGKCLSTEYVGCRTRMEWECYLGHTWETSYSCIRQGRWCPECAILHKRNFKNMSNWQYTKQEYRMSIQEYFARIYPDKYK